MKDISLHTAVPLAYQFSFGNLNSSTKSTFLSRSHTWSCLLHLFKHHLPGLSAHKAAVSAGQNVLLLSVLLLSWYFGVFLLFIFNKANFPALLSTPHPLTLSPLAACSDCCSVIKFLGCGLALGHRVCAGSTHYGSLIGICSVFCFGFVNKQRSRCQFLAGGGQTPGAAMLAAATAGPLGKSCGCIDGLIVPLPTNCVLNSS